MLGLELKKAIIVSPSEYFEFFQQAFSDWETQHSVLSIDQMWNDLGDESLDENSEIVVLNDIYYDEESEQLELAIITLADDALVLVIADSDYKERIQQKISSIAVRRNIPHVSRFWFISRDNPINEINNALVEYEQYLPTREQEKMYQIDLATQQSYSEPDSIQPTNGGFTEDDTEEYIQQTQTQRYNENYDPNYSEGTEPNPYSQNPYLASDNSQYENNHISQEVIKGHSPQQYDSTPIAARGGSGRSSDPSHSASHAPQGHDSRTNLTTSGSYAGDGYTGPERNGMIIASTSSKGGSGKSTVGICTASMIYHSSRLANEAGQSPRPLDVVIVDLDTRDGQIGFLLGESTPTVLNIFTSQDFSRNNIRQNLVYNERLGVSALLAPKRARTADYTTPELYRDIISKLRTMFDIVILDTSVNYTDPLIYDVILPVSDAVLFVTDMSKGAVFGMTRWIAEVTIPIEDGGAAAISKEKIGVVVNKSMGNVGFDQKNLLEAASGVPLIASIPMDSAAVLAATNNNHLDDIVLRHPVISPAYFSLVEQIIQNSVPIKAPEPFDPDDPTGAKNSKQKPPLPPKRKKLFGK
jgi:MinD-like ATPase involved in chromosome partitioning or flagellar assembly